MNATQLIDTAFEMVHTFRGLARTRRETLRRGRRGKSPMTRYEEMLMGAQPKPVGFTPNPEFSMRDVATPITYGEYIAATRERFAGDVIRAIREHLRFLGAEDVGGYVPWANFPFGWKFTGSVPLGYFSRSPHVLNGWETFKEVDPADSIIHAGDILAYIPLVGSETYGMGYEAMIEYVERINRIDAVPGYFQIGSLTEHLALEHLTREDSYSIAVPIGERVLTRTRFTNYLWKERMGTLNYHPGGVSGVWPGWCFDESADSKFGAPGFMPVVRIPAQAGRSRLSRS